MRVNCTTTGKMTCPSGPDGAISWPQRSRAHKISNTVALKGSMVLLMSDAYCVSSRFFSSTIGEMPIQVAGLLERPAQLVALRNIVEQRAFFRLVAVDFQAEHAEAGIVQTAADNFKRGELFGDKEHRFASGKRCRDQIRDGLRLAGARRTFDDQILSAKRMNERAVLGAVGVPDEMRNVFYQLGCINRDTLPQARYSGFFEPSNNSRTSGCWAMLWPAGHVFGSRSRYIRSLPKLRSASVMCRRMDQAFLELEDVGEFSEIDLGRIVFFKGWYFQPEVPAHLLDQRKIGFHVLAGILQDGLDGPALPARAFNCYRQNDERGQVRLLRVIGLIPLQESEHEVQHVRAGFLDRRLGGTRDFAAELSSCS